VITWISIDIHWIWIWSDIHAHGYFYGRGNAKLVDQDLDLVLQYPTKPAALPSLPSIRHRKTGYDALGRYMAHRD
jgi:hypothetical protein